MNSRTIVMLAAVVTLGSGTAARGAQPDQTGPDSASDTRLSAAQSSSPDEEKESPLGIQAYSFLYGPMLSDPRAGEVATTWTDQTSGVSVQNQIGLRYDLTDNVQLMPTFDFEVLVTDPNQLYGKQYVALTYDSFIRLNIPQLSSFSLGEHQGWLGADARFFVPSSDYSRDNNSLGSVRLTLTPTLNIAHTSWSFALVNFARYYFQRQQMETFNPSIPLPRLMLYTAPLVSYSVSDKLVLWSLFEMSATLDTRGHRNNLDANRSLVDFEPGFDWHVGDHIIISPYLNWFLRQGLDTTTVNVTASLSL